MTKGEFANLNVGDTVFANFSNQMKQATVAQKTATKALLWVNGPTASWNGGRLIAASVRTPQAELPQSLRY